MEEGSATEVVNLGLACGLSRPSFGLWGVDKGLRGLKLDYPSACMSSV